MISQYRVSNKLFSLIILRTSVHVINSPRMPIFLITVYHPIVYRAIGSRTAGSGEGICHLRECEDEVSSPHLSGAIVDLLPW